MSKKNKISLIALIILSGFSISVYYHYFLISHSLGVVNPALSKFLLYASRFGDFLHPYEVSVNLNPYYEKSGWYGSYFPFHFIIYYLFTLIGNKYISLFLWEIIFITFFTTYVYKNISHSELKNHKIEYFINIFIISFLSYPYLWVLERGNSEMYLFMFLASYLFFINAKRYELSAFILALPTAMKLYPAVFVIILLKKKRYREIAYFVLFTMLLTIISLILLKGSVSSNLQGLSDSMEWWSNRYLKDSISEVYISEDGTIVGGQPGMGVHWNTSYFAVVRLFTQYIFQIDYVDISKLYLFFCILVFGFVCYFVVFIEKQFWKQVAVLTFSMILLPWASFDYKLLHVFLPMMLFINEITNTRFDKLYSILFGFLLIPKSFINIATIRIISELYAIPALYPDRLAILPQDLNIGVIVNPVLITVMAIVIISEGISNKKIIKDSNNTD